MNYYLIAVSFPGKERGLVYSSQDDLDEGQVVKVPLGRRDEYGCVLSKTSQEKDLKFPELSKIKSVKEITFNEKLSKNELDLYEWMSQYYHYSLGKLIFDCLPTIVKRPRPLKFLSQENQRIEKIVPNHIQQEVIDNILKSLNVFNKFLIHGVTGSGKTIIYMELIKKVVQSNKSVLFLLPEINLTPQFVETFLGYLQIPILVYHSELNNSQKYQIWKKARDTNEPCLILGVRSSIFIPLNNLGLIIVDEEHDSSFKQDDRCPYNARDVAIKKAQLLKLPVILGSATPSLETYYAFSQGSFLNFNFKIKERAQGSALPQIKILDSREKTPSGHETWPLNQDAIGLIKSALDRKEQVVVFINRLGYSSYLQCRSCGAQFQCPNCSIALKYYKKKNLVSCHHCEYKETLPEMCSSCGCLTIIQKGFGTEKVHEVLSHVFPQYKVERFDRDEIKSFKELEQRIGDFHRGDIDILVGTQMLSKGHNFKNVKLVLILGIDAQMNFPDFRSMERVYQTLTQVSGRAGRYSQDGVVAIQTNAPDSSIFQILKEHQFDKFYENELELRKISDCPPFSKIAVIHVSSRFQDKLIEHVLNFIVPMLKQLIQKSFQEVKLLGPRPASVEKKSNQFTWTFMLKSNHLAHLHNLLKSFELNYQKQSSISYKIDVDPYSLN